MPGPTEVVVSSESGLAQDIVSGKQGFLDRIDRQIELSGNLDDSQRRRLLEIAERCPVHRTLKSEISIRTFLTA